MGPFVDRANNAAAIQTDFTFQEFFEILIRIISDSVLGYHSVVFPDIYSLSTDFRPLSLTILLWLPHCRTIMNCLPGKDVLNYWKRGLLISASKEGQLVVLQRRFYWYQVAGRTPLSCRFFQQLRFRLARDANLFWARFNFFGRSVTMSHQHPLTKDNFGKKLFLLVCLKSKISIAPEFFLRWNHAF